MKYLLFSLFIIIVFVIAVAIGTQNEQTVTFNYLVAKSDFRLSTLIILLFGGGFVLGWLFCGIFYIKSRVKQAVAERKLKRLQDNISTSSAIPVSNGRNHVHRE